MMKKCNAALYVRPNLELHSFSSVSLLMFRLATTRQGEWDKGDRERMQCSKKNSFKLSQDEQWIHLTQKKWILKIPNCWNKTTTPSSKPNHSNSTVECWTCAGIDAKRDFELTINHHRIQFPSVQSIQPEFQYKNING